MTQKLYSLYVECVDHCNKGIELKKKTIKQFIKEYGKEPFIDSDFLAGLNYGELYTKKELEKSILQEAVYET